MTQLSCDQTVYTWLRNSGPENELISVGRKKRKHRFLDKQVRWLSAKIKKISNIHFKTISRRITAADGLVTFAVFVPLSAFDFCWLSWPRVLASPWPLSSLYNNNFQPFFRKCSLLAPPMTRATLDFPRYDRSKLHITKYQPHCRQHTWLILLVRWIPVKPSSRVRIFPSPPLERIFAVFFL